MQMASFDEQGMPGVEIQEKSPELKASVPKRRNPAIIIKNVPNEVKNEDLLKVITEQNPEIVVDDESIRQCRVRFYFENLSTYKACCYRNSPHGS
ncbi:hypothetical protein TNCV_1332071 [Trichonephila clavipes]|nr:hypothetical protein TNCV_1332071 [Trichonephila clavipes]